MKKILLFICISILLIPVNTSALVYCNNCVVIDMDSDRILYENNKDKKMLIASITKIMTAVIAIENNNLDEMVTVGDEILSMYGSNLYLEIGEKSTLFSILLRNPFP